VREIARGLGVERRDDQHPAADALLAHVPSRFASEHECAAEVHGEHLVPPLVADPEHGVRLDPARARAVHENRDPAERRERRFEQPLGAARRREVARDELRVAPFPAQRLGGRSAACGVEVGEHDPRPFARKGLRDAAPDAGCRAGDERRVAG
jgi:hypothetical protein